ncbi:NAD(P)/FAD-dependent oxidoreductase [Ancylobacter moscoviensis]
MNLNRNPDPAAPKGASIVIVGGGVTGLSTGWWLAREGHDVLVLDKGVAGAEASGRNGGGCTHHFSPLFREEQRLWPMMDELLGYPTEFQPNRIKLALTEGQAGIYTAAMENGAYQGFSSERLDPRQVRDLVPLAGEDVLCGFFYHFGGHANPHRTLQGYAWAMQDHGGRFLQSCAVTGFRTADGRVTGVETERGLIACDRLVIAAGPQTGWLAGRLGAAVPMVLARAEMVVTEPLPVMRHGGVDGNGLYGRQTLRGNLAYGGGPHEWIDFDGVSTPEKPSTPLLGHIGRRIAELLPKAAHARIIRSWAGAIENTPDGRPVIDFLPGWENAVVATMSGVGFGLSPASGRVIRDLVIDGSCGFADISSFRLERFDALEPDWRALQGWQAIAPQAIVR